MSTVKSITLSHSSAGYDSYEKLNQIFVKGNKERAESYIKNLTKEYASDEKYNPKTSPANRFSEWGMISFCSKHIRNAIQDFLLSARWRLPRHSRKRTSLIWRNTF